MRCQINGYQKGAEGKTLFCNTRNGDQGCQYLRCIKSAEGRTDFCIGHGSGKWCDHEG